MTPDFVQLTGQDGGAVIVPTSAIQLVRAFPSDLGTPPLPGSEVMLGDPIAANGARLLAVRESVETIATMLRARVPSRRVKDADLE